MPPALHCVIAKPEPSVSTKWVYENLDLSKRPDGLNVSEVAEGIRRGDLSAICQNAANILETVTVPAYPIVGWIKEAFLESGAVLSLMSGSGSAVFGLFTTQQEAKDGASRQNNTPTPYLSYSMACYKTRPKGRILTPFRDPPPNRIIFPKRFILPMR